MSVAKHNLKYAVAALSATVLFSLPLAAQGPTVEDMLSDLASVGPEEAARLEKEIRHRWSQSGSSAMDLLLKRGRNALQAGETDEAIEHLTALTDHAPGFAEGWYERSLAYFHAGLYGPAMADLERALALNPQHFGAILGLAVILEQTEKPKLAYEAYLKVQEIHPHHEEVAEALTRLQARARGSDL